MFAGISCCSQANKLSVTLISDGNATSCLILSQEVFPHKLIVFSVMIPCFVKADNMILTTSSRDLHFDMNSTGIRSTFCQGRKNGSGFPRRFVWPPCVGGISP